MRPTLLDPLFSDITVLPKVGPKIAALLAKVLMRPRPEAMPRVIDVLLQPPSRFIDRRLKVLIQDAPPNTLVTLDVTVEKQNFAPQGRGNVPSRIICGDESGDVTLVFFRSKPVWLERAYAIGEKVTISGTIEYFNGLPSMVHPDLLSQSGDGDVALVEAVYPATAGLMPKATRNAVAEALKRLPDLPEWLSEERLDKRFFPTFDDALKTLHQPESPSDADLMSPARQRLAYDEILSGQLSLALLRASIKQVEGKSALGDGKKVAALRAALPFKLTGAQNRSIVEIAQDLAKPERMVRLLQGDVGSGKTVVALLSAATMAEVGRQTAIMAPTELLSRQHFASMEPIAKAAGLRIILLVGKMKAAEKRTIAEQIVSGAVDIVVGTHALFQDAITFHALGLVVVDEQHRFGVHQRLKLTAKGEAPDLLVMTATPIPRTLVLAAYGDMDVSRLDEKPAGRKPIQTVSTPIERLDELGARIEAAVKDGGKCYWVCPLVEQSEALGDLISAEQRHEWFEKRGNAKIGLIHGRMTSDEKDTAMADFRSGMTQILVATTVIEVGVDVPDATIMVIEHAERFGLAQLHQLRGRVGRGEAKSSCVLLYKGPLGETAQARLKVMRDTEDGFIIAEEDLRLRGEGDLLGTRQAGAIVFRMADLSVHGPLLAEARDEARYIVAKNPDLNGPKGEALRHLLYLFSRDEAVRLLKSG